MSLKNTALSLKNLLKKAFKYYNIPDEILAKWEDQLVTTAQQELAVTLLEKFTTESSKEEIEKALTKSEDDPAKFLEQVAEKFPLDEIEKIASTIMTKLVGEFIATLHQATIQRKSRINKL